MSFKLKRPHVLNGQRIPRAPEGQNPSPMLRGFWSGTRMIDTVLLFGTETPETCHIAVPPGVW